MYNRKKEIIKSFIYISFILLIAVVSTHYIYYKFQKNHDIDVSSDSLDITYHENTGNKISIKKVTPVTDSVGLSSKSYSISVKNNLTEDVSYKIKIVDDNNAVDEDKCEDFLISKDNIRVSIKLNKNDNQIYDLNSLDDGILLHSNINALDTDEIAIRLWVKQDTALPIGTLMHYHGIIQVIEEKA